MKSALRKVCFSLFLVTFVGCASAQSESLYKLLRCGAVSAACLFPKGQKESIIQLEPADYFSGLTVTRLEKQGIDLLVLEQESSDYSPPFKVVVIGVEDGVFGVKAVMPSWDEPEIVDVNGDGIGELILTDNPFSIFWTDMYKFPVAIDLSGFPGAVEIDRSGGFYEERLSRMEKGRAVMKEFCGDQKNNVCAKNIERAAMQIEAVKSVMGLVVGKY